MTLPKLRYFLREALHNLWQFKTRHIFSLTIICLSFVTVGVVLSLSGNLRVKARELSKNLKVVFYLKKDAPPADREAVEAAVRSSPLIGSVRAVGPDQAIDRFRTNFPDLRDILQNLGTNPFPASIEAGLKDAAVSPERVLGFIAEVRKLAAVEDVQYSREWAEKVRALGRLVEAVGLKGHRIGNAMWSDVHANFVVNLGGATARDCLALVKLARTRVRERFGVELELEVRLVGEFAPDELP